MILSSLLPSMSNNKKRFIYIYKICRPDYLIKQIFFFFGTFLGFSFAPNNEINYINFILILISIVFASSANYVLNEWCDRVPDSFHPIKKNRPIPSGKLQFIDVFATYFCLLTIVISILFIYKFTLIIKIIVFCILINGILYNQLPFRFKDKIFLDVFSESINNPLRFMAGWLAVSYAYPPITLILGVWLSGYFLMNCKRINEIVSWHGTKKEMKKYRPSLIIYTENKLILLSFILCLGAISSITIFFSIYKIEFCLLIPLIILAMAQYLRISFSNKDKIINNPNFIFSDKLISLSIGAFIIFSPILFKIEIPILREFFAKGFLPV